MRRPWIIIFCFATALWLWGYSPGLVYADGPVPLNPDAVWFSEDVDDTQSVVWGDVDNDGDLDLAAGNCGAPNEFYENDGGLLQSHSTWMSQEDDCTQEISWGDMDNDGDLDLVVIDSSRLSEQQPVARIYLNADNMLQDTPVWTSSLVTGTTYYPYFYSIALGDVDNDGDLDLAVGGEANSFPYSINRLYLNEGDTLQVNPIWLSEDSYPPRLTYSLDWGDVDGDGDLDLAAGKSWGQNEVYLNEGGVLETVASWISSEEDESTLSVAWGDVDGDGDLDLAAGSVGQNKVYLNEGGVLETVASWMSEVDEHTRSVAWGDVDGDGDLDLAVGDAGRNSVYLNKDGVLETTASWFSNDDDYTKSIAWGDVDGDGDLDLAAGNSNAPNKVYLNTSDILGQINRGTWTPDDGEDSWAAIDLGDVDVDGDLDLVVAGLNAPDRIYFNEGGKFQQTATLLTEDEDRTVSIDLGDMNGDGYLDLAVGKLMSSNKVYLNDGGTFQSTPIWISEDSAETQSVAWGDVDGDGDLDLAVGNSRFFQSGESSNKVYLNENGLLQTSPAWVSPINDTTLSIAWGDVNNDGDLDLIVGNDGYQYLYLNENGMLQNDPVWVSVNGIRTSDVAWGDMDGDGDLDLAVGSSLANGSGEQNIVYLNENGMLQDEPIWTSNDLDGTDSIAWGDVDGDGDLDLAVANSSTWISTDQGYVKVQDKIYLNEEGILQSDPIWTSGDDYNTGSIAWGDIDGNGQLDLVIGNKREKPVVYPNLANSLDQLNKDISWNSRDLDNTRSIAWGDVDNDGDLDLAVGNYYSEDKVYLNEDGFLQTDLSDLWRDSHDFDDTDSIFWGDVEGDGDLDLIGFGYFKVVFLNQDGYLSNEPTPYDSGINISLKIAAWGDVDNDGDLDLAVEDRGQSKVFLNQGGTLQSDPAWLSPDGNDTKSLAWGDINGDGNLDLVVGNSEQPNQVYFNDGKILQTTAGWFSLDTDDTSSIALGDVDGDGDLDLAVGNSGQLGQSNKFYLNQGGILQTTSAWVSEEINKTYSIAWGDVDNDGDLDLAAANSNASNRVYINQRRRDTEPQDAPPYIKISAPGKMAETSFFSTPHIHKSTNIPITYKLFHSQETTVAKILPEFSPNGGGLWFPATLGTGGDGLTNLTASPNGSSHIFDWYAAADLVKSENVVFRITVQPKYTHSPILWAAKSTQTMPFRVEAAEWFAKVVDETGDPLAGATVIQNGQPITLTVGGSSMTNKAGLLRLDNPSPGTPLVALAPVYTQPTTRAAHDGWAYRTYLTSLPLDSSGVPSPTLVGQPGEQRLVVRQDSPLILFNLVASVEWDASDAYLADLETAFENASAYLYDVTDGQMAFGQVTIYDQAQFWADADFQFSTKNAVRPYAFVGGLISLDKAHTIRLGRFWNGNSGSEGAWSEPDGYRTMIHEFGHYALHLYDAYFLRRVDENGNFIDEVDSFCTAEANRENESEATNATIMDYQYNATELADKTHNWSGNCDYTEQSRRNNGESDWETLARIYPDLTTPTDRGALMIGPDLFPTQLLPAPQIMVTNGGTTGETALKLQVMDETQQPIQGALVALKKTYDDLVIDQGLTDSDGKIDIYGATADDLIRAATFDGALAGSLNVGSETSYDLVLFSTAPAQNLSSQSSSPPYLSLIPDSDGDAVRLRVYGAAPNNPALDAEIIPGDGAGSPQATELAYSPTTGTYEAVVSFAGVGLGTGRIEVYGEALPSRLNSDYNLQRSVATTITHLYGEDGNFELLIPPGGVDTSGYATVLPTGYVPGPLPASRQVIGNAYEVRLSGATTTLQKEGLIRLHYHPDISGEYDDLTIYYWEASSDSWQEIGGQAGEVDNVLTAPGRRLGIYALMGRPTVTTPPVEDGDRIYLPLIVK